MLTIFSYKQNIGDVKQKKYGIATFLSNKDESSKIGKKIIELWFYALNSIYV